jgi:Transglycosylase-like domain
LNRKVLASAMTVGVLSAPVAIAVADENDNDNVNQTPAAEAAQLHNEARTTVDVKRAAARLEARREAKAERKAKAKKRAKKRAKLAKKRAAQGQGATQQAGGGSATPAHLQAIAACESGGNPSAIGGGGAYRGKYQFDQQTWASVGGTGDPAAAPEAEQDKRAAMLYARAGAAPWPVCGS